MSKKENTVMESMTMEQAKTALENVVAQYNNTVDAAERTKLELDAKELSAKYNTLSLLTSYATVMKDAQPLVALAKAYNYPTISFKTNVADALVDGKAKKVKVASAETSVKTHNMYDFMEWAAKHNKKVAANGNWKSKAEEARRVINDEWKKYMDTEDGYKMSKTAIKNAVQGMFDALVFIPGESGKNAVIAKSAIANYLIALAARNKVEIEDGKINFKVEFLGSGNWRAKAFDVLHMAIEGKTFSVVYGDPEETVNAATVTTTAPAEEPAPATGKKSSTGKKKPTAKK